MPAAWRMFLKTETSFQPISSIAFSGACIWYHRPFIFSIFLSHCRTQLLNIVNWVFNQTFKSVAVIPQKSSCSVIIDIKTRCTLYMGKKANYTLLRVVLWTYHLNLHLKNKTTIDAAYLILFFFSMWWGNNIKGFKSF